MPKEKGKFTQGPWEVSESNTSIWGISPWNARVRLANVIKHSEMNGIDYAANARLIAASPRMFDVLQLAIRSLAVAVNNDSFKDCALPNIGQKTLEICERVTQEIIEQR